MGFAPGHKARILASGWVFDAQGRPALALASLKNFLSSLTLKAVPYKLIDNGFDLQIRTCLKCLL
jgi:hypothetical protein